MRRVGGGTIRRAVAALAIAAAGLIAACASEDASAVGCPVLCPGRDVAVLDTSFAAVAFDTTLVGFPAQGDEGLILLATAPGDRLDVRGLFRFDTLATRYTPPLADTTSPITAPDSARLVLLVDTASSRADADFTIEAYDVDTTGVPDTATAALAPLVRQDRLFASGTFSKDSIRDTMRLAVDPARLAAALGGPQRVRLGFRVRSSGNAAVALRQGIDGNVLQRRVQLRYRPAADSGLTTLSFWPSSATPAREPAIALQFRDRSWTVVGTPPVPTGQFGVGGMPGSRAYLAFDIPSRIVDSSDVLRATLTLTQAPYDGPRRRDTLDLRPYMVIAARGIELGRAGNLVIPAISALRQALGVRSFTDALNVPVAGQGARSLDITAALREWRTSGPTGMRRDILLGIGPENYDPGQLRFHSARAADPAVRPRLRVVYTARARSGLP